jgi:serine/threonine-protein kinase
MTEDVFGIVGTVQGGAFRVDDVVAEGGFAVVYRAYHGAFRSSVALKCLKIPSMFSPDEQKEFLEKFREEAELLFRLSSATPSVVRPLHVGTLVQKEGRFVPFIALEWLEGYTLDSLVSSRALARKPPVDVRTITRMLTPVADALCRAHNFPTPSGVVSIIHRDLKPENVFIAKVHGKEVAKVLDFGIAKVKSAATQMVGRHSAGDALAAFTPAYGAPEQWLPRRYGQTGPWTDVWGLALTVVEVVCGHQPIDGDQAAMMGAAIDVARRPTPRNEGAEVSDAIEAVFTQALAVDPRERFHDVSAFWNALCRAVGLPEVIGERSASVMPPAPDGPEAGGRASSPEDRPSATALQAHGVPDLVVDRASAHSGPAAGVARPVVAASRAPARRIAAPEPSLGHQFDSLEDAGPALHIETATPPVRAQPMMMRGDPPLRPGFSRAYSRRLSQKFVRGDLGLSTPIKLFAASVALMATDYVYASYTGEVLRLGPARMLWVAGPLALLGVIVLLQRLLSVTD